MHIYTVFTFRTPKPPLPSLSPHARCIYLYSISQHLIHPRDLRCNTHINSPLTNLHDQTTKDLRVDFGDDLQLLALGVL
jgi:hypothetical protein